MRRLLLSPPPLYYFFSSLVVSCPNPNSPLDSILHLFPKSYLWGLLSSSSSSLSFRFGVSIFAERSRYSLREVDCFRQVCFFPCREAALRWFWFDRLILCCSARDHVLVCVFSVVQFDLVFTSLDFNSPSKASLFVISLYMHPISCFLVLVSVHLILRLSARDLIRL